MASELLQKYLDAAESSNTKDAYGHDWSSFVVWCHEQGHAPLPGAPQVVAEYLAHLAGDRGKKRNTVARALAGINHHHEEAGHPKPGSFKLVRDALRGIKRAHADEELDEAAPLRIELLRECVKLLQGTPQRIARDKVLLTVGFHGALRRSELVALRVEDLRFMQSGLAVRIVRSKTDQEGRGVDIGLSHTRDGVTDPASAVREWLRVSAIREGPLLRAVRKNGAVSQRHLEASSVNDLVRAAVARTGMPPAEVAAFSGHSMRAGFVTSARAAGVPDHVITRTTRHVDLRMLGTYTREADLFANAQQSAAW